MVNKMSDSESDSDGAGEAFMEEGSEFEADSSNEDEDDENAEDSTSEGESVIGDPSGDSDESDSEKDAPETSPFADWTKEFQPDVYNFINPDPSHYFRINPDSTPFSILQQLITEDMVATIVEESARYAAQVKRSRPRAFKKWEPFNESEFWRSIAVCLLMGQMKKPSIKEYWSLDPLIVTPIFGQIMSRNRFQDIMRSLHFVNNDAVSLNETFNRFHKLGNFMPSLISTFRSSVPPGECLDESLVAYKGRLSFRQYNPKKRARFGIKLFILVDCGSGIVIEILPYQGDSTRIRHRNLIPELGFGGAAVMTLLENYRFSNHKVIIDNYFNSPSLAHRLLEDGIYPLGTVQKRRKNMPKGTRMTKKLRKGEIETFSNGKILIERWEDRREVLILNTFLPHEMQAVESANPGNNREKPKTVLLYNSKMGGVDEADKMMKPYQSSRKTYKWYKRIFFYLLDLAIYNAHKLHNRLDDTLKYCHKDFIRKIVTEILDKYPSPLKRRGRPSSNNENLDPLREGKHFSETVSDRDGVKVWSNCSYCWRLGKRKQTKNRCKQCQVRLCTSTFDGPSCMELYHTVPNLPKRPRQAVQVLQGQNPAA